MSVLLALARSLQFTVTFAIKHRFIKYAIKQFRARGGLFIISLLSIFLQLYTVMVLAISALMKHRSCILCLYVSDQVLHFLL